ncbi:MAG: response regulator [Candidatus Latescibacterota bacterium]|jgi:DNA-binding NtrC family response regulator
MIIDDEPIVGERLKAPLERASFVVEAFSSSKEALDRLREETFDILVTDLKMSSPDGMEVLRTAQQIRPAIKSVVITGFATKATAEKAKQSGAVRFVAKPFKISELKDLLLELAMSEDVEGE